MYPRSLREYFREFEQYGNASIRDYWGKTEGPVSHASFLNFDTSTSLKHLHGDF